MILSDGTRVKDSVVYEVRYPADDDENLSDMAPALALMRADPLDCGETLITFAEHFEAIPALWRRNAIGVHTRREWPMSEPLPLPSSVLPFATATPSPTTDARAP